MMLRLAGSDFWLDAEPDAWVLIRKRGRDGPTERLGRYPTLEGAVAGAEEHGLPDPAVAEVRALAAMGDAAVRAAEERPDG